MSKKIWKSFTVKTSNGPWTLDPHTWVIIRDSDGLALEIRQGDSCLDYFDKVNGTDRELIEQTIVSCVAVHLLDADYNSDLPITEKSLA